ncbi:hypothetical protein E2C01_079830 [Portunus trituberculatus]|uniref:Uncharacterized protein n=1 Tax=Portunus trituberculatus TaxID=210409 RepID=A0A5B7IHW7_PORTR|nr:hypothetical protein [Portunus trituberculatus]
MIKPRRPHSAPGSRRSSPLRYLGYPPLQQVLPLCSGPLCFKASGPIQQRKGVRHLQISLR